MRNLTLIKRTTPPCPAALDDEGIEYGTIDITEQPEAVDKYGLTGIPTLVIGDEVLIGFQSVERIKELMEEDD